MRRTFGEFPNLVNHSDCEGGYARDGFPGKNSDLLTGNSADLLAELNKLKAWITPGIRSEMRGGQLLDELLELVADAVETDGEIVFS